MIVVPRGGFAGPGRWRGAPSERFWAKVDKSGDCWLWQGGRTPHGYGHFWLNGTTVNAHRFAYEEKYGPIPAGMHLDHLCVNASCVNPSHLEAVTQTENVKRQGYRRSHCKHGHEFTPENTYIHPKRGTRHCRECQRDAERRRKSA